MARTITAANSVFMLSVAGLFPVPQRLQGYSADAAFAFDEVENAETQMGVDGKLSAGYTPVPRKQKVMLQADSASMFIFDQIIDQEEIQREKFVLSGTLLIPSVGRKWSLLNGYLTSFTPAPEAKKVLQPRSFGLTWESTPGGPA